MGDDETCRIEAAGDEAWSIERARLVPAALRRTPEGEAASADKQAGEGGAEAASRRIARDLVQAGARHSGQDA